MDQQTGTRSYEIHIICLTMFEDELFDTMEVGANCYLLKSAEPRKSKKPSWK